MQEFQWLREFGGSVLFHKVDSAGRGNPGEELLAIVEICGCEAVVYTPAYPSAGRIVRNARLEVSDFSGQRNGLELMHSIPETEQKRVCIFPVSNADSLRNGMIRARESGKDIWLFDAETQEDLRQWPWRDRCGNAREPARLKTRGCLQREERWRWWGQIIR
jgi:uncharacterized protein YgbK (DUF1537 family)